jgi:hypothetical protein
VRGFSDEAVDALHSLQRRGFAGVHIDTQTWHLSVTGKIVFDDYQRHLRDQR